MGTNKLFSFFLPMKFSIFFFFFFLEVLVDAIQMSTHNICFYKEISKKDIHAHKHRISII